tara:strand:- start:1795 stop:2019 length:225 start_codon:yes stop_codon:yes gene_type:complete
MPTTHAIKDQVKAIKLLDKVKNKLISYYECSIFDDDFSTAIEYCNFTEEEESLIENLANEITEAKFNIEFKFQD